MDALGTMVSQCAKSILLIRTQHYAGTYGLQGLSHKSSPIHYLNWSISHGSRKPFNISAEWTSASQIPVLPSGENGYNVSLRGIYLHS